MIHSFVCTSVINASTDIDASLKTQIERYKGIKVLSLNVSHRTAEIATQ